ncbi:thymidine kinase [Mesoplasma photuris]|uniref:thymidine kinase n=1 Tax=Mesoplasma photuris TaxID=217731 RepID=UPI0004E2645D|nr:thymidine kinase [Mesoplasma photuris]
MIREQEVNSNSVNKLGRIELITGCMFAGKTEEFIRRLRRNDYAKKRVVAFKPSIDNRYSEDLIASHSGAVLKSYPVSSVEQLIEIYKKENAISPIDIIGIDEVQFMDKKIVPFIELLANNGVIVIVTGLDKDFRSEPFQNVDKLLVLAEFVDKLTAICHKCGNFANRTQRIINGEPANWDSPIVLVGETDSYEARCRNCYKLPKK